MSTRILAPHYLRLEREMRCDVAAAWRALTDLHELRAWWAIPICEFSPGVGGGFEARYVARNRLDAFTITRWEEGRRIGGHWQFSGADGRVDEVISLTPLQGHIRVTIEQGEFPSFGVEATRVFGYHKIDTRARLDRLQEWLEKRMPANLARMPQV